ncbi:MAG: alpha/beta hydrolase fold domain-containing protein [Myxococcota bacterium]
MHLRLGFLPFLVLLACSDSSSPSPDGAVQDGAMDDAAPSDGPSLDAEGAPMLTLVPGEAPVEVAAGTLYTTVNYGEGERQLFDAFLPAADEPTPAVLFFHGGGFTGGNLRRAYADDTVGTLQGLVENGVAYFTVGYTLLDATGEATGVLKSLRDSQRALQFIRYHAPSFRIDPARIAVYGTSAGAGTCLWLAFHDDMADPESADPIARMSTRVVAAAAQTTQSTYDLLRWADDVYSPTYPITSDVLLADGDLVASATRFYGLDATLANDTNALVAELNTEPLAAYRADVDMIGLLSADDPPFWVRNNGADRAPGDPRFDVLHHPLHASALQDRANALNIEGAQIHAPALNLGEAVDVMAFLLANL